MNTENTAQNMHTNSATYSPEDNKLRLYVGRVPRDEYEKLRADGWTSTPKQNCDFVATWTPTRRDTALEYAGMIEDEDQSPAERAADRAERFSGYRDKRTHEAGGHADRFDAGPSAHGYQSQARAERAAQRHDKIAARAVDSWSKAEYWTQRTAGVISHALYKSTPGVRMGRIKILETELRRMTARPGYCPDWIEHYRLRVAYENQMCEAVGGRASLVEMVAGGFIAERQILKVNKSAVTGQVVSVNIHGTTKRYKKGALIVGHGPVLINIERLKADLYRPPTEAELVEFQAKQKAEKAARPKVEKPALINPTDADAAKLQAIWNTTHRDPSEPLRMTQAEYAARSGSTFSVCKTVVVNEFGQEKSFSLMFERSRSEVFKVRRACGAEFNQAPRVVVLVDKPQKPLPWEAVEAARASHPTPDTLRPRLAEIAEELRNPWLSDKNRELLEAAAYIGWITLSSVTQMSWTEKGVTELKNSQAVTA
jgi:hypothetical protein